MPSVDPASNRRLFNALQAIAQKPGDPYRQKEAALAFEAQGRTEEAQRYMERAEQLAADLAIK